MVCVHVPLALRSISPNGSSSNWNAHTHIIKKIVCPYSANDGQSEIANKW